ncbi:hypothetical protein [Burkholderia anthina]|uniref:hypothetical protein n=1 Tax=Burkholderia anthina TaxID=179879 RepID=UPI00158CD65B|nr:hypothetical protein [Burkholderia anthina]
MLKQTFVHKAVPNYGVRLAPRPAALTTAESTRTAKADTPMRSSSAPKETTIADGSAPRQRPARHVPASEKRTVCLFESDRRRSGDARVDPSARAFEGGTISGVLNADQSVTLHTSALSYTDARLFASGMLRPVQKRTGRSPDFRGHLDVPFDSQFETTEYTEDVAGWWKVTRGGTQYLFLVLTRRPKVTKR